MTIALTPTEALERLHLQVASGDAAGRRQHVTAERRLEVIRLLSSLPSDQRTQAGLTRALKASTATVKRDVKALTERLLVRVHVIVEEVPLSAKVSGVIVRLLAQLSRRPALKEVATVADLAGLIKTTEAELRHAIAVSPLVRLEYRLTPSGHRLAIEAATLTRSA